MTNLSEGRLLRWWESMFLSPEELKEKKIPPAPTLYKAELKRCQDIEAVTFTEGFRALWFSLPEDITKEAEQKTVTLWAMIAVTLVYVKTNTTTNLATAAGTKTENDKPIVSTHRFAQLQAAKTPDEFIMRLRRILQQLKGQVSVLSLAKDIEQWMWEYHHPRAYRANKRLCVQWAMDYYKAAK
ncbi:MULTISPECIES: type I-E CRISPR-associated protein Cse2/CasB [Xenorhabdus]|uniref:CRISPR-associated Cse2 family protein n=1 Tax=Xenorhabdus ehlersii TaxID=290111 RepID=A0A2D0IYS8_9GAMM|nr:MULTISPECIES: type I-E CRISPR-associated protein Cse2/CasB [Xenorhabdus]MBC8948637.1 type I-E CRISPR-associated protein Cse2/CasB [Xenorhabdus sp. TS4]PHM27054.1 type I-E CRISPR-associated protein Cse2/CasB [Xenorhabdus ehlersii]RKE92531.1 CRISPR-associated Cse2 family protein [Xenorhabdus ehlersii]